MFSFLSKKFSSIFSSLVGRGTITEKNIQEALGQVKNALLDADVPYEVVESFIALLKKEVVGQKIVGSLKPAEHLTKIVHTKLIDFLGGKQAKKFSFQMPSVVMVMGLQGSGKTTTIAKMVNWVKKDKKKKRLPILVASVDFYRPAAVDQLKILAQQVDCSFYQAKSDDAVEAAQEIYAYYKKHNFSLLFLDTAGRLHVDDAMLQELHAINSKIFPHCNLLVLDSMTGQESLKVANTFNKKIGFQAAILTKMDSDARGGAAFAFYYSLKKPVVFTGSGEKIDDLDLFYPERIASRLLGMGDIQTLLEKADEKIKKSEQKSTFDFIGKGQLTLDDFAQQIGMIHQLGSLSSISKYLPGMGRAEVSQDTINQGESELKTFRAIINSMTPKERLNHRILNGSRRKRIAQGAGVSVSAVNLLLNRFEQMQQYVKLFKKAGSFKRLFK